VEWAPRHSEAELAERRTRPRIRITKERYKMAMRARTSLLRPWRKIVCDARGLHWADDDGLPKAPHEVDDGYGAFRGRGVQRPTSTAKLAPRAQGSMPGRTAKAVEIKQSNLTKREIEVEGVGLSAVPTGRFVSNVMPSERGHRVRYSSKAVRITKTLEDGSKVVLGKRGILKTKTEALNRRPRAQKVRRAWIKV
jgi:hypothetical protein